MNSALSKIFLMSFIMVGAVHAAEAGDKNAKRFLFEPIYANGEHMAGKDDVDSMLVCMRSVARATLEKSLDSGKDMPAARDAASEAIIALAATLSSAGAKKLPSALAADCAACSVVDHGAICASAMQSAFLISAATTTLSLSAVETQPSVGATRPVETTGANCASAMQSAFEISASQGLK